MKIAVIYTALTFASISMAAVPKSETYVLGKVEKKIELVSTQQGCEVLYKGKQIAKAKQRQGLCEEVYKKVASNLSKGGFKVSSAAPAPAESATGKSEIEKK